MTTSPWSRRARPLAILAAVAGFAMLAIYLTLIISEGNNDLWASAPWAVAMAVAAILAVTGASITTDSSARKLLFGSAFLSFMLGIVSILSIGIGFIGTGALALVAANRLPQAG